MCIRDRDGLLITGENILEKSDYIELVGEIENQSIKDIDLADLSERLEQNAFVKAARISKHYPNLIKVDIVEREPIAILNNKVQLMIDDEAVILPHNSFTDNALIPVLSGFNPAHDLYPEGFVVLIHAVGGLEKQPETSRQRQLSSTRERLP